MTSTRPLMLFVLSILLLAFSAMPARAQQAPTRIAIADPGRIFSEIQETKDVQAKMEAEMIGLQNEERRRQADIQAKKEARDQLKPDSPQFHERNKEFLQASIDYRAWIEITKMETERARKMQIKALYDKIAAAVGEIATQRGIDLVIAEIGGELPKPVEELSVAEVRAALSNRNILYSSPKVDISPDVIALMDARYKGASATPPTPQP